MFEEEIYGKDRFTLSANVCVGTADVRHITITKESEGFIGDWLEAFKSILLAAGFTITDVYVVMSDGETEFGSDI